MKKTYEFETMPYTEYSIKCWTKDNGWHTTTTWTDNVDEAKKVCAAYLSCGTIAKIVKRTTFYENYMWDEYSEWLQERKAEKEELHLTNEQAQRLLKAIFAHTEGEDDE